MAVKSKQKDYSDLDYHDPIKLLRTKREIEELQIKDNKKYVEELQKIKKKPGRKKKVQYDPTKEEILWEGEKNELLPGAFFQPVLSRYNAGSPRLFILVTRANAIRGNYTKVVLRRIPYEIFRTFLAWFQQLHPLFEQEHFKFTQAKMAQLHARLQNDFTFPDSSATVEEEEMDF